MLKIEGRESAHLKSRVKDLSIVPNLVNYTGLFACITPISIIPVNSDECYDPVLIRDRDSLIATFGDPRIDPEKYIDLYSIMQTVSSGSSCYISKVPSGTNGVYSLDLGARATVDLTITDLNTPSEDVPEKNKVYTSTPSVNSDFILTSVISTVNGVVTPLEIVASPGEDATKCSYSINGSNKLVITCGGEAVAGRSLQCAGYEKLTFTFATEEDKILDNKFTSEQIVDSTIKVLRISRKQSTEIIPLTIVDTLPLESTHSQCTCKVNHSTNKLEVVIGGVPLIADGATLIDYELSDSLNTHFVLDCNSSTTDVTDISVTISEAKPFSLKKYYLNVAVTTGVSVLSSAKVELSNTLTNADLVSTLTSLLSPYVSFSLVDNTHINACIANNERDYSIVKYILENYTIGYTNIRDKNLSDPVSITSSIIVQPAEFKVTLDNYKNAINQFKDKKYAGCLLADLVAPLNHYYNNAGVETAANTPFGVPTPEERRTLQYYLKEVATERKDCSVIMSVPLINNDNGNANTANRYDGKSLLDLDDVCNWVASHGVYSDLWQYGQTNTTDYAEQSFYLEMYYTWLNMQCVKFVNGLPTYLTVPVAPSCVVINNILTSFRERGVHLPVAGDQYGILSNNVSVIVNPKTKLQRDQLVQYRINPIWDTGTRGIQIYGNETLNAGYTDLNAAHIARSLINIRSRIDNYTETLKFLLNNNVLWDTWKAYVSSNILEPAKSINAIRSYSVAMGYDTTTPEEIANRKVNGQVSLQFYQSAEIFDLTFTIFSTAAEELG